VAEFIGQANIFDVTISAVNHMAITMLLPSGHVAQAQSQHLFQSGKKTKFALRPESIDISFNKIDGKNSFPGIVKRINYLGAFLNISVEIGQLTLTVICTSKSQSLSLGNSDVFVNWDYTCGILFN
jgi:ABC-type Fe3+/spermidine/putrescine transport system ATPase subunit